MPDRARRALLVIFAVNGLILATWASRIPVVKGAAGLSVAGLGAVLLAPALGALVAFEPSSRAAVRYGSAGVTGGCALAFCLVLPAIALTDSSVPWLVVVLLLFGAGNGALDVAMNTHGVSVEAALGRPVLSGLHAAFSAGALLGAASGGLAAAAHLGLGAHFTVMAVVGVGCVLVARRGLWLAATTLPPAPLRRRSPRRSRDRPRRRRGFLPGPVLLLGAVGFACLLGEGAAADWSATYMRTSVHASAALAATAYAGFSGAMLGGRIIGDHLRARLPATKLLAISAGGASAGLACGLGIGGPAAGIGGFAAFGAGLAVVIPIVFSAAGTLPAARTGMPAPTALARVNTLSYLGLLAGPPIVGAVAAATGLRVALLLAAGLAGAVALLARPALRRE